jgi:hypothetical protein
MGKAEIIHSGKGGVVAAASYKPELVSSPAPNAGPRKKNPVLQVFAMNDYVVFVRKDKSRHPVHRAEALRRMNAIMEAFYMEDAGKPRDELEYERWLVEQVIKACARSAEMVKRPYRSADVTAKLRQLDNVYNRIKRGDLLRGKDGPKSV